MPGQWLAWFILPNAIYVILISVLSIVVQAVSPNKFVGWGIMLRRKVCPVVDSSSPYTLTINNCPTR
jgi:hypothetical protein